MTNEGDTVVGEDTIEPISHEVGEINRYEILGVTKANPH